ncbi:type IV secretory system conjugative DNA transfer family protein [Amycolatopsis lurida]|uniref:type IV secretory system conjugative DNA transfer family protein n=1 Tax=Amycolatopsis lurida TaxID=31959 RepID=UPI003661DF85
MNLPESTSANRAFTLTFPVDVQAAQVQAWLRSVIGTSRSSWQRRPTMTFELWAAGRGLTHRLLVPAAQADYVSSQLRSLLPGIRVTPKQPSTYPAWSAAVELAMSHPLRTLYVPAVEPVSATLLASLQGLRADETVLLQLVATPAARENAPVVSGGSPIEKARRKEEGGKLADPNFLVTIRVAVRAGTELRIAHLLSQVHTAFKSLNGPKMRFKQKFGTRKSGVSKRIERAAGNLLYGAQLSITEMSAVIGWPIGAPHVAGLPTGRARQLPAGGAIPRSGRVIGKSNFPGAERPVAVSYGEATKHVHILGPTGTGKTTLLANMVATDMRQGYGVIVLESKGDLFHLAMRAVPRRRIKDVIVLDVNDTEYPVGFNILNSSTSHSAVDELSALITSIYSDNRGIYAPMLLYYGLHALAETPGCTFIDLPTLLTPQSPEEAAWRDQVVRDVTSRDVRLFWQRYLNDSRKDQDRMATPVHNRIWQLAVRPEIRNIIGQSTSSFTFEAVLRSGKILLINLNGTRVGEMTASLTGTLLMNAIYSAVRTVKMTKPSFLYLDEFQDFVNLPVNAADLLAKTRSFGLGLVLAHQDLDQLGKVRGLEQAVLANARTKVVFQTSARDARTMQREFGRLVAEEDFLNLGAYEAIGRIATADGVSAPITLVANPPLKATGFAAAVALASRTAYGRPIEHVEAEIEARRRLAGGRVQPKPKLGPQKWEK